MAQKTRTELDAYFETGDTPTEAQFQDLIDSVPNFQDDKNYYGKEINITAHAGGGQADAYELTNKVNVIIVCANTGNSVKLPAGNIIRIFFVYNKTANTVTLYPPVGGEINQFGINAGTNIAGGNWRLYVNYDNKKWTEIS